MEKTNHQIAFLASKILFKYLIEKIMGTITVNGKSYEGDDLLISNNKIILDNNDITPEIPDDNNSVVFTQIGPITINSKQKPLVMFSINISIEGNFNSLNVGSCDKLGIIGNVGSVTTGSADITVQGNINGNAKTGSGDIECTSILGDATTGSGDIKSKSISGTATTKSGDIITK